MARDRGRIEPTFDTPAQKSDSGMRMSAADRVLPETSKRPAKSPNKSNARKRPAKAGPARRQKGKKQQRQKRRGLFWALGKLTYWGLVLCLWAGIGVTGVVGYYAAQLPSSSSWAIPKRPPNAKILSINGELIANRGATGGAAMRLSDMSPYIPMAVIAIEDRRFHSHFGFDPIGFTRAMTRNVISGRLVQGGSTLTQQLAKNIFLKPERTLERKVQELIMAFWLETKFTKDQILEMYLNRVYFGSGAYGVDAASRRYFNKSARDVNLAEAALLAGLLKAPSRLSPAKNPKLANERAQVVLATMKRSNFITESEANSAKVMKAQKAKRFWSGSEHYAADIVIKQIPKLIGELRDDVIVDTTIDFSMQKEAGSVIRDTLAENGKKRNVSQGALVSMTPYGAIRAVVGGREYSESQFNRAFDAKRQPGSAFKPIVYLTALQAGRTPESVRQDAPVRIGKWTPVNYDRKYRGPVTLDVSLSKSLNTVAAQLVMEAGPDKVIETAKRLGIGSKLKANASIALGTSEVSLLELTASYAPFANGGEAIRPYIIRRITDLEGNMLYERGSPTPKQVVYPRELGMMNAMMKNVVQKGTAKAARLKGHEVAGKTGTSQNSRDGLFIGYTANLVTGIWYGNDDSSPTKKVTGGSLPASSWQKYMSYAHKNLPAIPLPGRYEQEPQVVSLPTPSNSIGGGDRSGEQTNNQVRRRTLSEINGNLRPKGNVGEGKKPRTILDILFGKD